MCRNMDMSNDVEKISDYNLKYEIIIDVIILRKDKYGYEFQGKT